MKQSTWLLLGIAALCICIGILLAWVLLKKPALLDAFQDLSSPIISDPAATNKTPITVIPPTFVDALNDQVNLRRIEIEDNILAATEPVQETTLQYALFYTDKDIDDALNLIMSYYSNTMIFYDFERLATIYMRQNLSTVEDILYTTINGIPPMMDKGTFPESWAIYALKVSGNNPFTARKFILDNYSNMDTLVLKASDPAAYDILTADNATWDVSAQGGVWNADGTSNGQADAVIRTRVCKELESATELFREKLEGLRTAAKDLSSSIQTATKAKQENWNTQTNAMDSTKTSSPCITGGSPSANCKRLASIDAYLYDLVPDYEQADNDLYSELVDINDKLNTLLHAANLYRCPFATDLSGLNVVINSLSDTTNPTPDADILSYTGEIQPEILISALKSFSPYYISPDVTNYVSRSLSYIKNSDDNPYKMTNRTYEKLMNINAKL